MVRPMVHSTKHYIQNSLETITAGSVNNNTLVDSVDVGDKNLAQEVEEGNSVKAIWIEQWVRGATAVGGSFVYAVYKVPGGAGAFSAAEMAALQSADNKKNVLYMTQALSNDQLSTAIPMHKGWLKIPKSKQRMGLGDRIIASFFAQALDANICGMATYKEYS